MSKNNYTTNKRKFKHLTREKRAQIEILLKQGTPKIKIAKEIGISRSTLYNEIKRGTIEQVDTNLKTYTKYCWDAGQRVYEENRQNSRPATKFVKAYKFLKYAEEQILHNKLSPDAICGRAKVTEQFKEIVCTKTLYNYIDQCLLKVRNIDLPLRVKRKTKRNKDRQNRRIYGASISERPEAINDRKEFGHWEIDTIVGKKETSDVLLSLDERMTRKRHLVKISSRSTEAVKEGLSKISELYGEKFELVFKSITSDNGSEFADLNMCLPNTDIYYAHPYSSFERGTNEKQNSLVRRLFPKGRSFDDVPDEAIAAVEQWINDLPRKIFNYSSANILFENVLFDIAI